jgi:PAS domain S-box-containing protein
MYKGKAGQLNSKALADGSETVCHPCRGAVEALPPVPGNRAGLDLGTTLERIQQNFVISDPSLPDSPIVFASDDFLVLTGYTREEVLGRNCRFLQGPQTDPRAIKEIRDAIATASECTVRILNYRKDGSPFWNMFSIAPVFDTKCEP